MKYFSREKRDGLLDYPNVIGHGVGFKYRNGRRTDEVCVVAYVVNKVPLEQLDPSDVIPAEFEGLRTDVVEEAIPHANISGSRGEQIRPLSGGLRGGGEGGGAGTLPGTGKYEDSDGDVVAVTNRHVTCDADEDCTGVRCNQPFGGDRIGEAKLLGDFHEAPEANLDAAYVSIDDDVEITDQMFGGMPMGDHEEPVLGERYVNTGSTTGFTSGMCVSLDVSISVGYGWASVPFTGWAVFENYSMGGDSGSATGKFEDGRFAPVALHVAATEAHSYAHPWSKVYDLLGELTPVETGHTPVAGSGPSHYEATVYDISVQETRIRLDVVVASTGGDEVTSTEITIASSTGATVDSQSVEIIPGRYTTTHFLIPFHHNDTTISLSTDTGHEEDVILALGPGDLEDRVGPVSVKVLDENDDPKLNIQAMKAVKRENFDEMDHCSIELLRPEWFILDDMLDRRNDTIVVEPADDIRDSFFAGRFDQDTRGDGTVTVDIEGFEIDARDTFPTTENAVLNNLSTRSMAIVLINGFRGSDEFNGIETLRTGQLDFLASGMTMSFSYSEISKALREVAMAGGGEIQYRFDKSIDVVERRGDDRDIILYPGQQNIEDPLRLTEDNREDVTHIVGFGAQSGPSQVTAQATSDRYQGGRVVARKYEDKSVEEEDILQRVVNRIMDEIDDEPRHVEVTATVTGIDLALGDRLHVRLPEENIDKELRIVEKQTRLDDDGKITAITLSNRVFTEDNLQKMREDLQRFNRAHQGFIDRSQVTSGWDLCGDGTPQELLIQNWPDDIVHAESIELNVQGRAWRSPISIDADTSLIDFEPTFQEAVSWGSMNIGPGWTTLDTANLNDDFGFLFGTITLTMDDNESGITLVSLRLRDTDTGTNYPRQIGYQVRTRPSDAKSVTIMASGDFSGGNFALQAWLPEEDHVDGPDSREYFVSTMWQAAGNVLTTEPAIVDSFNGVQQFPSTVLIYNNNSLLGTINGDPDGRWSDTITIHEHQMSEGENLIQAYPQNSRGEINLSLQSELFRRGPSDVE